MLPLFLIFFFFWVSFGAVLYRRVFLAASTGTWKPVRNAHFGQNYSAHPIDTKKADGPIILVNIVSRTYTARLAKGRLEGQF